MTHRQEVAICSVCFARPRMRKTALVIRLPGSDRWHHTKIIGEDTYGEPMYDLRVAKHEAVVPGVT